MPIPTACRVGPLYVSGSISGRDRTSGDVPGDLDDEVRQLFDNIRTVLAAGEATTDDVAKFTFTVRDRSVRPLVNQYWVEMFPDPENRPVRHTVEHRVPDPLNIQAEFIAYVVSNGEEETLT